MISHETLRVAAAVGSCATASLQGSVESAARIQRVAICDAFPLMIESFRTIVANTPGFEPGSTATSLWGAVQILQRDETDILFIDGGFGMDTILQLVSYHHYQRGTSSKPQVVVFSPTFSTREKECFLRVGIKGLLRKDAQAEAIQDCIRTVAHGGTWIETSPLAGRSRPDLKSAGLTYRELQVLRLASEGLKYGAIGTELGISSGTVKLHMKHIFEKTGVRGRTAAVLKHLAESNEPSRPQMREPVTSVLK